MKISKLLFAAVLAVCSCTGQDFQDEASRISRDGLSHEKIVLGAKLDDPYTVQNMTKALMSVYPSKAGRVELEPTDFYVRFLPKNDEDCEKLESLGVELIDHPIDYKVVREGDYYQDPSIPDEEMTWQYAVVRCGFIFPEDIRHEILDECYIAEHDESSKASMSDIDWAAVERESYMLTGNEDMLPQEGKGSYDPTYPSGRITIVDDAKGPEPIGVAGVRVQCNAFVKFANCYTDENGNYKMNRSFTSDIRYRIRFRNVKGFNIGFNLIFVQASSSTLGKSSPVGVSVNIDRNSERKLFTRCVVNNAGYDYITKCKENGYSIKTPPANLRIWLFQLLNLSSAPMLQQGALIDNSLLAKYLGDYILLIKIFLPDITLGLRDCDDYESVYNLAIHEFSHASHYMQVGNSWWDEYMKYLLRSYITSGGITYGVGTEAGHGHCEVAEMWAFYNQTKFNRMRYGSTVNYGGGYWFSPQALVSLDEKGVDRFKIFKALTKDVTTKDELQDKLIELYPGSKSLINQAFERYE